MTKYGYIYYTSIPYYIAIYLLKILLRMVMTMDTNAKLNQILKERGWTTYKLSAESGLSHTTLANVFRRNTVPSISTLEKICAGFGITLSQFFAEGEMVEMTPELKQFFDKWITLTKEQKDAVLKIMDAMSND